jgi:formylglycine-generating enzyme
MECRQRQWLLPLIMAMAWLGGSLLPPWPAASSTAIAADPQAWEFRGVIPGQSGEADLLVDANWGQPRDRSTAAGGLTILLYKMENHDVHVTIRDKKVIAIDIMLPEGVDLEKTAQIFQLRSPLPAASLPEEAQWGPAVSDTLRPQRYAPDGVVVFVREREGVRKAERVRFYSPAPAPSKPPASTDQPAVNLATLPVWKYRGIQPGLSKKEALLADPQWSKPLKRESGAQNEETLHYRVSNADVVLFLRDDIVRTIDLQFSDSATLAQVTQTFHLTGQLPDQAIPPLARIGPSVPRPWQARQFACGRVIVYVDENTSPELARRVRFYGPTVVARLFRNTLGMTMKRIPAGEFRMGSHESAADVLRLFDVENERAVAEHPQHSVSITRPFYMAACETTVAQFRQFVTETGYRVEAQATPQEEVNDVVARIGGGTWEQPGFAQTQSQPVVSVSWHDAVAFCQWLSKKENRKYRLPTEAEWEYACRAGTTGRYSCGEEPESLVAVGNVLDLSAYEQLSNVTSYIPARDGYAFTSPVGRFRPNDFGIYDMHGNAWEWCQDWYQAEYYASSPRPDPPGPASGNRRVFRGGCWY